MINYSIFFAILSLLQVALGHTVDGIFQSLSISNPSQLNRPQDIRTANLKWKLVSGDVLPKDTFRINMPYVFRTKIGDDKLTLSDSNTTYASCVAHDGSFEKDATSVDCTVEKEFQGTISGELSFDFVFNAGGSSKGVDIAAAKKWSAGDNKVKWGSLSSDVEFESGPFFSPPNGDTDNLIYYSRSVPDNGEQIYFLSGACKGGITSGKMALTTNATFDASKFSIEASNSFNDFMFPKAASDVSCNVKCSSDKKTLVAEFGGIEDGFRPFIQGVVDSLNGENSVKHTYVYSLQCGDGSTKSEAIGRVIKFVDGSASSEGSQDITPSSSDDDTTSTIYISGTTIVTVPCHVCTQSKTAVMSSSTSSLSITSKTPCHECEHTSSSSKIEQSSTTTTECHQCEENSTPISSYTPTSSSVRLLPSSSSPERYQTSSSLAETSIATPSSTTEQSSSTASSESSEVSVSSSSSSSLSTTESSSQIITQTQSMTSTEFTTKCNATTASQITSSVPIASSDTSTSSESTAISETSISSQVTTSRESTTASETTRTSELTTSSEPTPSTEVESSHSTTFSSGFTVQTSDTTSSEDTTKSSASSGSTPVPTSVESSSTNSVATPSSSVLDTEVSSEHTSAPSTPSASTDVTETVSSVTTYLTTVSCSNSFIESSVTSTITSTQTSSTTDTVACSTGCKNDHSTSSAALVSSSSTSECSGSGCNYTLKPEPSQSASYTSCTESCEGAKSSGVLATSSSAPFTTQPSAATTSSASSWTSTPSTVYTYPSPSSSAAAQPPVSVSYLGEATYRKASSTISIVVFLFYLSF